MHGRGDPRFIGHPQDQINIVINYTWTSDSTKDHRNDCFNNFRLNYDGDISRSRIKINMISKKGFCFQITQEGLHSSESSFLWE